MVGGEGYARGWGGVSGVMGWVCSWEWRWGLADVERALVKRERERETERIWYNSKVAVVNSSGRGIVVVVVV